MLESVEPMQVLSVGERSRKGKLLQPGNGILLVK